MKSNDTHTHNTLEDIVSSLQLRDTIDEEGPEILRWWRFGSNSPDSLISQLDDLDGTEDLLEASDDVALNDLRGDIVDEDLFFDLVDVSMGKVVDTGAGRGRDKPCRWQTNIEVPLRSCSSPCWGR